MTGIPENIIEEVVARSDIVSVVGEYVRFTKTSGQNQFGLCPFHSEDTPSFSVSITKQIYYCFGCHKGGNVINFIMEIEKLTYPEAIRLLAERVQVSIPEPQDDGYRIVAEKRDAIRAALLDAARYFYKSLQSSQGARAKDYIKKRELSESTVRTFGLGYAPDSRDGLYRYLKEKNYSDEVIDECGLFTRSKRGDRVDLFRGRLMFPIFDTMGKIIAFGGRTILTDGMPKYINSPETAVYSKKSTLYALNFAKAVREKTLIIVEGYMDVISMYQAGLKNVVATLGTALTEKQMTLASRYAEELILFYDSDRAGQEAAVRGLRLLMAKMASQSTLQVRLSVGRVPDGKDPDQFIREHGAEAFRRVAADAAPVMAYLIGVAETQSTIDGRFDPRVYQEMACTFLSWETNAINRERFAGKVAERLGVSVASVLQEVVRTESQSKNSEPVRFRSGAEREQDMAPIPTDTMYASADEIRFIGMISMLPEAYIKLPDRPLPQDFSQGNMREIATNVFMLAAQGQIDVNKLLEISSDMTLNGKPAKDYFSRMIMKSSVGALTDEVIDIFINLLYRIRFETYKQRKKTLVESLSGNLSDQERVRNQALLREVEQYLKYLRQQIRPDEPDTM